jgi:carbonic anhydrase
LDNAVRVHLERMVAQLKAAEPILSEAVKSGQLKIIGGYYHLDRGRVEMMPSD